MKTGLRSLACLALLIAGAIPAAAQWRQRDFVIGGYFFTRQHDPSSRFDPRPLVQLDAAGLDLVVSGCWFDSTEARSTVRMLDSLRTHRTGFKLKTLIMYYQPWNPSIVSVNPAFSGNWWAVREALAPKWGINSPSVEGYMVWDEPIEPRDFENIKGMTTLIDTLATTRGKLPFVNLLPIYASGQPRFDALYGHGKAEAYARYLDRYLGMFDADPNPAPLLCVDHYPYQTPTSRRDYCLNLRLMREAVERHSPPARRIPMWMVVQLAPYREPRAAYAATPSDAQIRWQVFAALAYGVKGVLYWTLVPAYEEQFGPGLLDARGAKSARYDFIRSLNTEVRGLGATLMRLDPVGVYHQNASNDEGIDADRIADTRRSRKLVADMTGGSNRGMVGWLRDRANGDDYLFVVNKDVSTARAFTVSLAPALRGVERITTAGPISAPCDTVARTFTTASLAPGAGALYHVIRP